MSSSLATVSYIGATILFILSLGGLSHPESSRRGNLYGMIGMTIAVLAKDNAEPATGLEYGTQIGDELLGAGVVTARRVHGSSAHVVTSVHQALAHGGQRQAPWLLGVDAGVAGVQAGHGCGLVLGVPFEVVATSDAGAD